MNKDAVIEAQKHAECLNEAWCELLTLRHLLDTDRINLLKHEMSARIWAVIQLLQYPISGRELPPDAAACIREADAFDGPVEGLSNATTDADRTRGTH